MSAASTAIEVNCPTVPDVSTVSVRHYNYRDTPVTAILGSRLKAFRDERLLDRLGRVGGWYLVARALA